MLVIKENGVSHVAIAMWIVSSRPRGILRVISCGSPHNPRGEVLLLLWNHHRHVRKQKLGLRDIWSHLANSPSCLLHQVAWPQRCSVPRILSLGSREPKAKGGFSQCSPWHPGRGAPSPPNDPWGRNDYRSNIKTLTCHSHLFLSVCAACTVSRQIRPEAGVRTQMSSVEPDINVIQKKNWF